MSTLQILIIISFIILVLLCFYIVAKCKQIPEPIYRTVALNDQGKIVVLSIDWWTFSPFRYDPRNLCTYSYFYFYFSHLHMHHMHSQSNQQT